VVKRMSKKLWMGNEAIAFGAIRAGVGVVTGYPGTPSTEVLETIAKHNDNGRIYVEWSVNEKAAMEVAAGAAYAGQRALVTMKQVGLNVASDPLMSLAYVGVKGGMVVFVADDPGPISSQTEQDTRTFAAFSKLPIFDPTSPEEAYTMMADAFELSERLGTPVLFRATTRICHACATVEADDTVYEVTPEGFTKDPRWVIFPRLSYAAHKHIEARNAQLSDTFSGYAGNTLTGAGTLGIAAGGVAWAYLNEVLDGTEGVKLLKVTTPHPFPDKLAAAFLEGVSEVLVLEELDPVIERALIAVCGKQGLPVTVRGKLDGTTPAAGELSAETVRVLVADFVGRELPAEAALDLPPLPVRPPVLCAGCPHRASFYAVKQAAKQMKKNAVFCGDIGCYTLGNALPLDMTDTCLCMGAGITVAQGIKRVEPDRLCFSFTGDSTFFHTGLVGIVNAVYNKTPMVAVILDNSSTAMTGHQPNPATGKTVTGEVAERISIEGVLTALGVSTVLTADPFDLAAAIDTVKQAAVAAENAVAAIVFRAPCIAVTKPTPALKVAENCIGCKKCVKELGCPAIVRDGERVRIDTALCTGCGLCAKICPVNAIGGGANV